MRLGAFLAAIAIAWVLPVRPAAAADQVVFLVRHAEREAAPAGQPAHGAMMADDPPLSASGRQRADRLAAMLASAGIEHIFTTEYRRTRETAGPLAQKLKLASVMSAAKDPAPLLARVRRVRGNVLIVGHSNTLPDLIKQLGIKTPVTIDDNEFDNLFVLVRPASGAPTLIRLRY
jgi:probable phosphoglycerate mutase